MENYSGTLKLQQQLLLDYEEDIIEYAGGLDKGRIFSVYRRIPMFLGKENKKFQVSKIHLGARNRDYIGVVEWLGNEGIINICHCLSIPELPLKGNYKIYFRDTGLLIGSSDEEVQEDLRYNKNFNTYKEAIYENIVVDMLVKQGYQLYFYRNEEGVLEIDFIVRDAFSLVPVEVKTNDYSTKSLNKLIDGNQYTDVKYGIKFADKNIGFNGKFYTFPYFLDFFLKRFLREHKDFKNDIKYIYSDKNTNKPIQLSELLKKELKSKAYKISSLYRRRGIKLVFTDIEKIRMNLK